MCVELRVVMLHQLGATVYMRTRNISCVEFPPIMYQEFSEGYKGREV